MPVINIDYNDASVSENDVQALSEALQKIVSDATHIDDVNVYANTAHIKVNVLPIEVFIRMSAGIINDEAALLEDIRTHLADWKSTHTYPHPINIYLIPMHWQVASDI
jgi:hypothetical protein